MINSAKGWSRVRVMGKRHGDHQLSREEVKAPAASTWAMDPEMCQSSGLVPAENHIYHKYPGIQGGTKIFLIKGHLKL